MPNSPIFFRSTNPASKVKSHHGFAFFQRSNHNQPYQTEGSLLWSLLPVNSPELNQTGQVLSSFHSSQNLTALTTVYNGQDSLITASHPDTASFALIYGKFLNLLNVIQLNRSSDDEENRALTPTSITNIKQAAINAIKEEDNPYEGEVSFIRLIMICRDLTPEATEETRSNLDAALREQLNESGSSANITERELAKKLACDLLSKKYNEHAFVSIVVQTITTRTPPLLISMLNNRKDPEEPLHIGHAM
jgi:hypothetical protein